MRAGYGRSLFEPLLPIILGRDISGEVAGVGNSVRSLSVGQEVFGALHPTAVRGTYSDYAVLSEEELAPKPSSITHVVNVNLFGFVVNYNLPTFMCITISMNIICSLMLDALVLSPVYFFLIIEYNMTLMVSRTLIGSKCNSLCCIDCMACSNIYC